MGSVIEVDNLKKRRSDREDELLGLMEVREELEAQERAAADQTVERLTLTYESANEEERRESLRISHRARR